jgi:hypothetical protein
MTETVAEAPTIVEPDWEADLADALTELGDAQPEYEKAERYYGGTESEKFLSPITRWLFKGSTNDFQVNLASAAVTAVTERLEIGSLTAAPAPPSEEEAEDTEAGEEGPNADDGGREGEATRVLNEVFWHHNELDIEAPEIHEKGVAQGDAYLFVWPQMEDGRVVGLDAFYNSPQSVRILYESENPRKKRLVIKQWSEGTGKDERIRVNLYYPGTPGHMRKLISAKRKKGNKASEFEPYVDEHTDADGVIVFPWVFEGLPFFHFRTSRPYGRPEHRPAYGSQDMLTKLIRNMMSTSDFAAFPQRYGLVDPTATTDDGDDLGDEDVSPEQANSQVIAGSGRMWLLRFLKSVGQFESADVDQFLKPIGLVQDFMGATTRTPISHFRLTQGGVSTRASGESQRQDKEPLLAKINARQRSFAATWREAGQFALKLLDIDAIVTVRWMPSQVVAGKEGWEAVRAQQEAGVPVRQTLLEAGYTDSEVTSWGYTVDNPDGPGMDLSGFAFPPPTPDATPPAATAGAGAPTPPTPGEGL